MRLWVIGLSALVLAALPIAWFAPLFSLKVKYRFWADATDFSVISTLQILWKDDPFIALLVSFFALFFPVLKLIGIITIEAGLLSERLKPGLDLMGRFAMADVFLIALAIAMVKGLDGGDLTVLWGFWAFSGLIITSILIGFLSKRPNDAS